VEPYYNDHRKLIGDLRELTKRLLVTSARISELSQNADVDSMREIIALRRELSDQLPQLGSVTLDVIDLMVTVNPADIRRKFLELLGHFKSQLSRLQSDWPAVTIRQRPSEYRRARGELDAAQTKLFDWLDQRLLRVV
jgi:hypothetical protein